MNFTVAKHGREALKVLSEDAAFDIIFMDINMLVMDGYTTSIKIRKKSPMEQASIIELDGLNITLGISK